MDSNKTRRAFEALKTELMAIAECDRLYWPPSHRSREDRVKYHQRQQRLSEIRLEMMALGSQTVQ